MGFQRGVLDPLGGERSLIGDRGLRQRGGDIAELAMDFRHDVARGVGDTVFRRLVGMDEQARPARSPAAGSTTAGRIS